MFVITVTPLFRTSHFVWRRFFKSSVTVLRLNNWRHVRPIFCWEYVLANELAAPPPHLQCGSNLDPEDGDCLSIRNDFEYLQRCTLRNALLLIFSTVTAFSLSQFHVYTGFHWRRFYNNNNNNNNNNNRIQAKYLYLEPTKRVYRMKQKSVEASSKRW